jgi:hypothetical protein
LIQNLVRALSVEVALRAVVAVDDGATVVADNAGATDFGGGAPHHLCVVVTRVDGVRHGELSVTHSHSSARARRRVAPPSSSRTQPYCHPTTLGRRPQPRMPHCAGSRSLPPSSAPRATW